MYIFGAQIDEISTFYRFHCGIGYSKLVSRNRLVQAVLLSLSGSRGDPVARRRPPGRLWQCRPVRCACGGGLQGWLAVGWRASRKRERGPKSPVTSNDYHIW